MCFGSNFLNRLTLYYTFSLFQVKRNVDTNSENDIKTKEQAILDLGELLAATGQAEGNCQENWLNSRKNIFLLIT